MRFFCNLLPNLRQTSLEDRIAYLKFLTMNWNENADEIIKIRLRPEMEMSMSDV